MKEYNDQRTPNVTERLAALRTTQPQSPHHELAPPSSKVAIRREFLLGGLVLLVAVGALMSVIVRRQQPEVISKMETATATMPTEDAIAANAPAASSDQSGLAPGEAYVAIPVESGHFPPRLKPGHIVRISITSTKDGVSTSDSFSSDATVQSVSAISDVGSGHVVTVLAPQDLLDKVAQASSVDLAIVGEVAQ